MAARQHLVGGRGPVLLGALPTSPSRHQIRDLAAPPFGLLSSMMNEEYMLMSIYYIYIYTIYCDRHSDFSILVARAAGFDTGARASPEV
jgi:hypothetical protein